jgi:hypothetical protein
VCNDGVGVVPMLRCMVSFQWSKVMFNIYHGTEAAVRCRSVIGMWRELSCEGGVFKLGTFN